MPINRNPDGQIALRPDAVGAIHPTLSARYGREPQLLKDRIGGAIMMLAWPFQRDGV